MRIPKYRKNSSRDSAFVEYRGKRHYLPGKHNSSESRDAYKAFLARIMVASPGNYLPPSSSGITVADVLLNFLDHAAERYGLETRGEYANCKHALSPLIKSQFGEVLAVNFGPKSLKTWRDSLRCSRGYVNQQLSKIKRAFRWAASEELIPVTIYQALATVPGLRAGETSATENRKRTGVPWPIVLATLAKLSPLVADMVRVQALTGCRSKSLCLARPEQFDRSDQELWLWRPRHKTESLGRELVIPIGPQAQAILGPYIDQAAADGYLFDPRTQRGNRRYRRHYATSSYYRAIQRAIERVNAERLAVAAEQGVPADQVELLPEWFPHQLRHARGQAVREKYGLEAAQATLGHDTLDATQIYSGRRLELAKQVARETG